MTATCTHVCDSAAATNNLTLGVAQLGHLSTYVDKLSSKFPLAVSPGLRAQMRRSAIDALSHMACALEASSSGDSRNLMLRSLGALAELNTFTRMGQLSGAVTPTEATHLGFLNSQATSVLRLALTEAA